MLRAIACCLIGAVFIAGTANAQSRPDFSKLDPAWAAQSLDEGFQTGESSAAWKALKAAFPEDYARLVDQMARAMIAGEDATALSGEFIGRHTAGEIPFAARAPAGKLVAYQKAKAALIQHLSSSNLPACAAIQAGAPPDIPTDGSDPEGARLLYALLGAFVDAAGAGHADPQGERAFSDADILELRAAMIARGASEATADEALSLPPSASDDAKCRAGVLLHTALASAPEALVAKLAIIAPR